MHLPTPPCAQLEKLKGEPSLSSAPVTREGSVDWSAELESAQLENKIFSVTLDTLREEVYRRTCT